MSSQILFAGAAFAFILGALLVVIYRLAMPIRDLLLSVGLIAQIADEGRFAEWRRKIGLAGATLCMVAALVLVLASVVQLV